jgi:hypothetical protein
MLVNIQNLVATGFGTVIKLAELIKGNIFPDAKNVMCDLFTVLGQIQNKLSLRRKYSIRPLLKKKYASLCETSMPVTTKLFGDDIRKEVKSCESTLSLRNTFSQQSPLYGFYGSNFRGRGRFPRKSYSSRYISRTQPYQSRGQYNRNMPRSRPFRRSVPTATATAPNDQA